MTVPRINTKVKDKVAVNCSFIILHKRSLTNFVWSRPFDKSKNCNWATNFENMQNKIKKSTGTDPILLPFKHLSDAVQTPSRCVQAQLFCMSEKECQRASNKQDLKESGRLKDWLKVPELPPKILLHKQFGGRKLVLHGSIPMISHWDPGLMQQTRNFKRGLPSDQAERGWKIGCGNQRTSIQSTNY